jgi:putative aminopeptidase
MKLQSQSPGGAAMKRRNSFFFYSLLSFFMMAVPAGAQSASPAPAGEGLRKDLKEFVETPAISGYENELVEKIRSKLAPYHPVVDNLGDVIVTIGSGAPHRLIVAPIDEPGFVVSGITDDGYLRVQRLPQGGLPPIFNELYSAQPVKVRTSSGKWIDGLFAGLSVHLQPGRTNAPKSSDIENMYVDIGATSATEVRKAGVDNLSPVVINRRMGYLGTEKMAGASIGDRFATAVLLELLRAIDPSKFAGTLTVAFVAQQRTGARGLQRILSTVQADELIYVGRLIPGGPVAGVENVHRAPRREPGSGVLIGLEKTDGKVEGLAAELKQLADANKISIETDYSAEIVPRGYLPPPAFPARWAHIAIAADWPDTPAEVVAVQDLAELEGLLDLYLNASRYVESLPGAGAASREGPGTVTPPSTAPPVTSTLKRLIETYGVSKHEGLVLKEVEHLLPPWAKPETDDAGNLILRVGTAPEGAKTQRILIVAHMDEIGFEVNKISKDGRLEVEWRGSGDLSFFAGHPALVHAAGGDHDAIMELLNQWDEPNFTWPKESERPIRVDVGARTPEEVTKLGIKIGDSVTIPKAYRPLLGTRANGRSFDDRVGDTALISAVWALGGPLKDRDVTFVWSTSEETGLVGAAALVKRLAAEGRVPDYVFAVDTFVSSDSPLESKRFADAQLGKGFVVRAVDNSNIVPRDLVEKLVKLARANQIPVQYGVTGGGNDGSAFVRYGSVDIALGWPLRYSHSPAELVDTRDVEALARIITAIARSW